MVQCAFCPNLTRKTRYCSYFKVTLKEAELHKQWKCDGNKWKKLVEVAA